MLIVSVIEFEELKKVPCSRVNESKIIIIPISDTFFVL